MITPYLFGAVGDGEADDSVAVQAAFDAGKDQRKAVELEGDFRLTRTLRLSGLNNHVYGRRGTLRLELSGVLLEIDAGSRGETSYNVIDGVTFVGSARDVKGLLLTGGGESFMGHNRFTHLAFRGMETAVLISKTADASHETRFDWNRFVDIDISGEGPWPAVNGIRHLEGSGTGNLYSMITFNGGRGGVGLDFQSYADGGKNIGDILISQLHTTNEEQGGVGLRFGWGAYRSNISVVCSQFEGVGVSVEAHNCTALNLIGCQWGGGTHEAIQGPATIYPTRRLGPPGPS